MGLFQRRYGSSNPRSARSRYPFQSSKQSQRHSKPTERLSQQREAIGSKIGVIVHQPLVEAGRGASATCWEFVLILPHNRPALI